MKPIEFRPSAPSVIGTGLIALDVILPREAERGPVLAAGGTCGNVLAIMAALGWKARPVARLNGDVASQHVREDLAHWDVGLEFAEMTPPAPTPVFVQLPRQRSELGGATHRFSANCPRCGAWLPSFRAVTKTAARDVLSLLSERDEATHVFFFDRAAPGSLTLARGLAEQGALIVFEPSGLGDPRLFAEALTIAHIIKYSADRIADLDAVTAVPSSLWMEIQTLGADGLRYRERISDVWKWRYLSAFQAPQIADTAGAGDWCTAAFLNVVGHNGIEGFRDLGTEQIEAALRTGQAAAAIACGFEGARGVLDLLGASQVRRAIADLIAGQLPALGRCAFDRAEIQIEYICPVCPS